MTGDNETTMIGSCGNAFRDIGFPNPERLKLAADLHLFLVNRVAEQTLAAADTAHYSPELRRAIDMIRANKPNIEQTLFTIFELGYDVKIELSPARSGKETNNTGTDTVEVITIDRGEVQTTLQT